MSKQHVYSVCMGVGNTLVAFKTNQRDLTSNKVPKYILFLAKLKREEGLFGVDKHRFVL